MSGWERGGAPPTASLTATSEPGHTPHEECNSGLGFGSSLEKQDRDNAASAAQALMKRYMADCLAYHDEQMKRQATDVPKPPASASSTTRHGHQQSSAANNWEVQNHGNNAPPSLSPLPTGPPLPMAPAVYPMGVTSGTTDWPLSAAVAPLSGNAAPMFVSSSIGADAELQQPQQQEQQSAIQQQQQQHDAMTAFRLEAVERARLIALQFQQQQPQPPQMSLLDQQQKEQLDIAMSCLDGATNEPTVLKPQDFKERRTRYVETTERKRMHQALLKNWEYISRRDESRAQQQAQQAADAQRHHEETARALRRNEERRREGLRAQVYGTSAAGNTTTTAGIGTQDRQRVEQSKKRAGNAAGSFQPNYDAHSAVYVTGLPTHKNSQKVAQIEDSLRQLFSSFGALDRVTLYKEKKRGGQLKGDALVVFASSTTTASTVETTRLERRQKMEELVTMVCAQLSGAELPGGYVLNVEPANPNYKLKQQYGGGKSTPPTKEEEACTTKGASAPIADKNEKEEGEGASSGGGDDLDDFFASL